VTAPLVSVVIPAWNAGTFIGRTLDSVKDQTFTDYEVIVTDDGSSDDTKDVVDAWLSRNNIAGRCIRQENTGVAGARNTAMRAARGRLIALLDSDDLWYPDKLARVIPEFDKHQEILLVGHHMTAVQNGKHVATLKKGPLVPKMYERLLFDGNALAPSAAVFKKQEALDIGGFREDRRLDTVEDYDFWLRLSLVGPYCLVDDVLAEYTIRPNSGSSRVDYHYSNLEYLLRSHFAEHYPNPSAFVRLRMRRRLAMVYRGAAAAMLATREEQPDQLAAYVRRMLTQYPLDWKNLVRAMQWAVRRYL
jgi:glycosyltransferase involved in cell wall biosynthesis